MDFKWIKWVFFLLYGCGSLIFTPIESILIRFTPILK